MKRTFVFITSVRAYPVRIAGCLAIADCRMYWIYVSGR